MSSSVAECVYEELSTSVALAAAVSTRIAPESRPTQYNLPCVVYEVGTATAANQLNGGASIVSGTVDVTVYAESVLGLDAAANAIRAAMDGVTGTLDGTNYAFQLQDETTEYEPAVDGEDFGVVSKRMTLFYTKDIED